MSQAASVLPNDKLVLLSHRLKHNAWTVIDPGVFHLKKGYFSCSG